MFESAHLNECSRLLVYVSAGCQLAHHLTHEVKINCKVKFYFLHVVRSSILAFLFVAAVKCRRSDTSDSWNEALNRELHRDTSMMKIDTGFCNFMRKYHVPAISVAVAKGERFVYLKSFGLAKLSDDIEADNQSLFRIVESSMTITSIAIKKLIAEGQLNYDSKVFGNGGVLGFQYGRNQYGKWITDLTVENLLKNQTGGWYGEDDVIADVNFRQLFSSRDSALSWALDHVPLKSPPGDTSNFSAFAYFVLGRVIEKVSGMTYENYVKENILRPAGITDMELARDDASRPHEVSYYFPSPTPNSISDLLRPRSNGEVHENLYLSRGDAALGWIASAADMVKLMANYRTIESLRSNADGSRASSLMDTAKASNGYSFDWCSTDLRRDWWESFQFLGSSTTLMRSSGGFCCVVLINTFRPDNPEFFPDLARTIKMINSDSTMRLPMAGG
jgi:CubicO group peptidase (beta-lactamase class C family)